jgi:23S rRNA (uracil1939-C5)-methyltransferase
VQQAAKRAQVARALGCDPDDLPLLSPGTPYGYRWRARLAASGGKVGYRGWRSHQLVEVATCPLLEPALDAELAALSTVAAVTAASAAASAKAPSGQPEAEVRLLRGRDGVASAWTYGEGTDAPMPAKRPTELNLARCDEPPFWLRAGLFAQPSEAGNDALRSLVRDAVAAGPGIPATRHVLELYAGAGNFTRDLCKLAGRIVAVESHPEAAALLSRNVPGAQVEVVRGAAERELKRCMAAATPRSPRFDVLVLDPPRAGAKEVCEQLAQMAAPERPPRIVYVSCDPMTLGRDVRLLTADGYHITKAVALDLMPQTYHVEAVIILDS